MDIWQSMFVWLSRLAYTGGGLAGVALGLLYFFQEKLIYVPRIPGVPNEYQYFPNSYGLDYEDAEFEAADGTKLHGWLMWPASLAKSRRRRRPCILFFQENAGNMSLRLPFLRLLARFLDCSVFAPSYRGYGLSEGSPNERGLQQDAQAALDYILQHPDVNPHMVSVYGKSLGGAVAAWLAANNPDALHSVVLENTFTSVEHVAPKVLPFLSPLLGERRPFNFLIRNKWRTYELMPALKHKPLLLLSALQDELLPAEQMRRLYDEVGGEACRSCTWVEFPEAHHMDTYEVASQDYWPALVSFFEKHRPPVEELVTVMDESHGSRGGGGRGHASHPLHLGMPDRPAGVQRFEIEDPDPPHATKAA